MQDSRPLWKTPGFVPLAVIMFLNAFIDLGHKITIQNTIFKLYDGSTMILLTAIVNAFILLPFIVLFRPAGHCSDRFSKTLVLRITALGALATTLGLVICYSQGWFWAAFFLTLLMAVQSAFYGPAKYGLLKELVENRQLARANGIVQGLIMVAILSGILVFSILFESLYRPGLPGPAGVIRTMTPLTCVLTAIALVECLLAFRLPWRAAAAGTGNHGELRRLLQSPALLPVVVGLAVFWSVGQMLLAVYPAFAKDALGITNTVIIQGLLATIAIGVMLGSWTDGLLSRQFIALKLLPVAAIGVIAVALWLPLNTRLPVAVLLFFSIGFFGGLLVVPLNAMLQFCSPADKLGITIANANLLQNIAMFLSLVLTVVASLLLIDVQYQLYLIALFALAGLGLMLKRMPQALAAWRFRGRLQVQGFNSLRGYGPVLFITDDNSAATQAAIRLCYPRQLASGIPATWQPETAAIASSEQYTGQQQQLPPGIAIYRVDTEKQARGTKIHFIPAN